MKGATTEPSARIIIPPKIIKTVIIGRSQSFFLILKKDHNSIKKSIIFLKLVLKAFRIRFIRCSNFPI